MTLPEFGTPMLVRAEVVRIIGSHEGDVYRFKQKTLDIKRWGTYSFKDTETWPGVAIPAELADTPAFWKVEPMPNGNAVMRCRRIALQTPAMGLYAGTTRMAEGTLITSTDEQRRPWRKRELDDKRWLDLYEILFPPTRNGRARLTLVHPFDIQALPMTMSPT